MFAENRPAPSLTVAESETWKGWLYQYAQDKGNHPHALTVALHAPRSTKIVCVITVCPRVTLGGMALHPSKFLQCLATQPKDGEAYESRNLCGKVASYMCRDLFGHYVPRCDDHAAPFSNRILIADYEA